MIPVEPADRRPLAGILLLAFVLRLTLVLFTPVIGADAPAYLMSAREMTGGVFGPALQTGIHPGYPALIVAGAWLTRDLEWSAYLVSCVLSTLAILPLFLLTFDLAGRRTAFLAVLLFTCLPALLQVHGDIMTEGTFHFFFLSGAAAVWFAVTRARLSLHLFAGVFGGLAYLVRPEGVYLIAALFGFTILFILTARSRGEAPAFRSLGFAMLSLLLFLTLSAPLLNWLHDSTGRWTLTNRASAQRATQSLSDGVDETKSDSPHPRGWIPALSALMEQLPKASFWTVPILFLPSLLLLRGRMDRFGALYLGCLAAGYSFAPVASAANGYALSHRYLLLPVIFLLPLNSLTLQWTYDEITRRGRETKAQRVLLTLFGVFLLACTIRAVHPRRVEDLPLRETALWLRDQNVGRVYANTNRTFHYLGRRTDPLPENRVQIEALLLQPEDRLFVIEADFEKEWPGGIEFLNSRFRQVARFPRVEASFPHKAVSIFAP